MCMGTEKFTTILVEAIVKDNNRSSSSCTEL